MGSLDVRIHWTFYNVGWWRTCESLLGPCLTGQRCDAWDDHYYRTPDVMAAMGHQYDDYNRSLPDVFVGEFAAS